MSRDLKEYTELARTLETEFRERQDAGILANLNKRNVEGLHVTREKILDDMRTQLADYQNEDGKGLTEDEEKLVLGLVSKEMWGYGLIDDLIHDKDVSDIKLYGPGRTRIKRLGKRAGADAVFSDDVEYRTFVTKLLERNKVNLGTANAIQTFTDSSQADFILRITVISGLLVDGGKPIVAIRKIPKDKYTLETLEKAGMFRHQERHKASDAGLSGSKWLSDAEDREDDGMRALIQRMVASKGILFTGKGASGKTTLMNAMIAEIPHDESVMICQENAELFDNSHPDLFSCHVMTNQGDSKISYELGDLTRAALLVDLDRVIVGEVKEGQEAAGLSKASMTGHRCWTSVHGESCEMAVDKMADYISQATGYNTRDAMKQLQGFEYVVHLRDFRVDEIIRIAGWDKDKERLIFESVYPFDVKGGRNESKDN